MNRRTDTMPAWKEIAMDQKEIFLSLRNVVDYKLDEAHKVCWACGFSKSKWRPTRAHIKAKSHGGSDDPSNFFLLCDRCHREQPDAASFDTQKNWLLQHENWITREVREAKEMFEKLRKIAISRNAEALLEEWVEKMSDRKDILMSKATRKSASAHQQTADSNWKWAFIEDFLDWLDDRKFFSGHSPGSA
jgi:hypothetical protein